jgi:hypothetical protein
MMACTTAVQKSRRGKARSDCLGPPMHAEKNDDPSLPTPSLSLACDEKSSLFTSYWISNVNIDVTVGRLIFTSRCSKILASSILQPRLLCL